MMNRQQTIYVLTGLGIGAAVVLAYAATKTAGPVQMTQYTELREGPLQEHLVTREELGMARGAPDPAHPQYDPRHNYPDRVAPWISHIIEKGWGVLYSIPDKTAMALPAEKAW